MKITAIYGSSRKNGNSSTMVDTFLMASNADIVEKFYLTDMSLNGCCACRACRDTGNCIYNDGITEILASIGSSDVVLMGSPLYWWSISAELKKVIDRFYAHKGDNFFRGKRLILLVSGASSYPSKGYALVYQMFDEISKYLSMDYTAYFVKANDINDVRNNMEVLDSIRMLAKLD